MSRLIVTCSVFEEELRGMLPPGEAARAVLLDMSYHRRPKRLRAAIQDIIDGTSDAEAVVVLYGCCGGITHLRPRGVPVIVPRANDCFDLMLGTAARLSEFQAEPGTYFLSEGWMRQDGTPAEKLRALRQRAPGDDDLVRDIYAGYRRLCFLRTGIETERSVQRAKAASDELGWTFLEKQAEMTMLKKALAGVWDDDFRVLQPETER